MSTNLQNHPSAFNPNDPNNWITLITGIAQIAVMLGPIIAQLLGSLNAPPPQPPAQ